MFLPISDAPNPPNFRPWVNWSLIVANVLVYVLLTLPLSGQAVDPTDPSLLAYLNALRGNLPPGVTPEMVAAQFDAWSLAVFDYGYKPGAGSVLDLFSCMFMHSGFMHLAGNMLFLYIYGDNCEHRLGRAGYLALYLVTGVAATLTFSVFAGDSMIPMVGASGAISGVLGMYFLFFPKNTVRTVIFIVFFFRLVELPARWVLAFYVIVQNFLPALMGGGGGVAYGAHLGGFFAGLGLAVAIAKVEWRRPKSEREWESRLGAEGRQTNVPSTDTLNQLERAIGSGDRRRAFQLFAIVHAPVAATIAPHLVATLASWLREDGHPISSGDLLRRAIGKNRGKSGPGIADLYLQMGLTRLAHGQPTSAYQFLLSVKDLSPDPRTLASATDALRHIRGQLN